MLSDHNGIKPELSNKRNSRKYTNSWRLNNMLLHDQRVIKEISGEIKKLLDFSENQRITYQNLCKTAKAVLRKKFMAMNAYI
jgi:hypothetical protein